MSYTFLKLAEETLLKAQRPLTAEEIWSKSAEYDLQKKCASSGKTPWRSIGAQIYVDMKENPKSIFCKVSKRPVRFFLKTLSNKSINIVVSEEIKDMQFCERDLHPLLSAYVYSDEHFKCYTKTIYHEKSAKKIKGTNKWLHPDIVGVYFPFDDYTESTLKIIESFSENVIKLFSFEMKIEINMSSLREYFFQAVSNSSWANEGYLAALKYSDEAELIDEMRRLNNSFGIGFIKLNCENIEQSEILLPAKYNNAVDWETINRLTDENPDFEKFIDSIVKDSTVKEVRGKYDEVYDSVKMLKHIKSHNIKS